MEYKNPKKGLLPITLSNGVTETFASRDWIFIEDSIAASSPMLLNAFKSGKLLKRFDPIVEPAKIEMPSLDKNVFIDNIIKIEKSTEEVFIPEEETISPVDKILDIKPQEKTKNKKSKEF